VWEVARGVASGRGFDLADGAEQKRESGRGLDRRDEMTGPDWALGREGGEVLDVAVPEGDDALCCGAPKWYGASKQARPAGCRLARQEQRDPGGTALQESGDTGVSDGDGRARLERGCCLESWEMGDGRWEMGDDGPAFLRTRGLLVVERGRPLSGTWIKMPLLLLLLLVAFSA